jgi:LacI family transcriptional regulator
MALSIKNIAHNANVSIATVSRIVNGNYPVKEETRQRVLKVMDELNYVPNEVARSLKTDSTHTIGFLVSDISNNYFTMIAKALEKTLSKINYSIMVCSTDERQDRELSYLKMLMGRKVDGLILNITGKNNDYICKISNTIPIVLIERKILKNDSVVDYIAHDNQRGIHLLVNHLLELNHRDIGIINGHLYYSTALERQDAFLSEMQEAGIKVTKNKTRFCNGDFSIEGGYKAAEQLFSRPHPPSAVIIMNNTMTVGALQYFRHKHILIPDDVSLVNLDSILNSDIFYVNPTHTTSNAELLGEKAAELLFSRMRNPEIKNREVLLDRELFIGNTTARFKKNTINPGQS